MQLIAISSDFIIIGLELLFSFHEFDFMGKMCCFYNTENHFFTYKASADKTAFILALIGKLHKLMAKRNFNFKIFSGDPVPGSVAPGHVHQVKYS